MWETGVKSKQKCTVSKFGNCELTFHRLAVDEFIGTRSQQSAIWTCAYGILRSSQLPRCAMSGSDSKPRDPHHAVLISLRSTFPVFQECRPLAIGIHKAVLERIPGINPQQLRLAMRMHTASARYLKALTNGETRFDLDGNTAGAVTPEQKEQALDTLRERFRKGAEQHKAQLLAQQQEQQRQEKLIRLAEKFNAQ